MRDDVDSPAEAAPPPLRFETDRGATRSVWIAGGIVVALVLWMGSGFVLPGEAPEAPPTAAAEPPTVVVATSRAEPVTLTFTAEGQAEPERDSSVRAEAAGTVVDLPVDRGVVVAEGDVLARLSSDQADATLAQAEEERVRARRELDNAVQLRDRGVGTDDRVAQARATLAAAEAQVAAAERALDDLTVTAAFGGRVEALPVTTGEFVTVGDQIARLVDNTPLTVAIQVPQQSLSRISVGQTAQVAFITGQSREGDVVFVGTAAAAETRTFLAEIEVANDDGAIPAGVSAEVTIPTGEAAAHLVAPSLVALGPEGDLGVKTVADDQVEFHPIEIVEAGLDGIWVTGLPDPAQVITLGQGFVRAGETVHLRSAADDAPMALSQAESMP